mgnify:FL=1
MKIDQATIDTITALPSPTIVAISGFGGSGKSTFAKLLGDALDAPVIGVDSFMKDRTIDKYALWEIMDFDRLTKEVLIPFHAEAKPITYGHFDWKSNEVAEQREVSNKGVLIIEGVGILRTSLLKYFSYSIWVDCPIEEAIARGKKRDRAVHHNPQDELWDGIWRNNDLEYFSTFSPKEVADLIIDNSQ